MHDCEGGRGCGGCVACEDEARSRLRMQFYRAASHATWRLFPDPQRSGEVAVLLAGVHEYVDPRPEALYVRLIPRGGDCGLVPLDW